MKKHRIVIASKSNRQHYYDADMWIYSYNLLDFIKTLIHEIDNCKEFNRTITKIYIEKK